MASIFQTLYWQSEYKSGSSSNVSHHFKFYFRQEKPIFASVSTPHTVGSGGLPVRSKYHLPFPQTFHCYFSKKKKILKVNINFKRCWFPQCSKLPASCLGYLLADRLLTSGFLCQSWNWLRICVTRADGFLARWSSVLYFLYRVLPTVLSPTRAYHISQIWLLPEVPASKQTLLKQPPKLDRNSSKQQQLKSYPFNCFPSWDHGTYFLGLPDRNVKMLWANGEGLQWLPYSWQGACVMEQHSLRITMWNGRSFPVSEIKRDEDEVNEQSLRVRWED